ncbi:MAG: DNA internalization-related competence protein ComEC/Rec2 [Candidatus Sumerlaeaceae bacterium]|nr:DNA internalization-related competence protein ComEC/Rec2 [Candidatus Sumerlaeaceae bacterium]
MTYFKRPIIPLLCLYGFGLAIGRYVPLIYLLVGAGAVACVGGVLRRDITPAIMGVVFLLGGAVSRNLVREAHQATNSLRSLAPPTSATVEGTVSFIEPTSDTGRRFVLRQAVIRTALGTVSLEGGVLVTLTARGEELTTQCPTVGQRIEVRGILDEPQSYRNFFVLDYGERLARQRIYAVLRTSSWTALSPRGIVGTIDEGLGDVRRYALNALSETLSGKESRWVGSLLFNDRRLLIRDEIRWLRDSNMFHLFAVSGLHVGALAAFVLMAVRALRLSWPLSWGVTVIIMWAYVAMTGFVPSALRAGTMLTAYGASTWFRREIDPIGALGLACLALLLAQPTLIYQTGFILSAVGVLGIVSFYPLLKQILPVGQLSHFPTWLNSCWQLLTDTVRVTIAVSLLIFPLQLYYFHQVNMLSPLANVLGAILAGPVIVSSLLTVGASLVSAPLANIIGASTAMLARALMGVIEMTAHQSWAIARTGHCPLVAVGGYYVILLSGYYFVRRDSPEFVPKARARLTLHCLGALLVLLVAMAWQRADRRLKIWFLDVGQGDSALLQLPTGQNILVDAGNSLPDVGRLVVVPHLQALGCYPLDYLVVTHLDSDHSGGVQAVLEEWQVGTLVIGNNVAELDRLLPQGAQADKLPRVVRVCAGHRTLVSPGLDVRVLNPDCSTTATVASENDDSLVLTVTYKDFSILMTGDAERKAESALLRDGVPKCDVLKVAHHGSASSTSDDFLNVLSPQIAVISCGRKNRYGHPSQVVVERLNAHGARVYRTDQHGAILIQTDGHLIEAQTVSQTAEHPHFDLE